MHITIIGTGNVATHLALGLHNARHQIIQVIGRNKDKAQELALKVNAKATNSLEQLSTSTQVVLLCITDNAIEDVAQMLPKANYLLLHTSGSIPIDALKSAQHFGVFYPLQSFSKNVPLNLKEIPFCLEANNSDTMETIKDLASTLSDHIYFLNSHERKQCHLAAVFANNFTNHMYTLAADILSKNKLPFEIIQPLIDETANKIKTTAPKDAQTGPAKRQDSLVIHEHLKQLKSDKLEKLYSFVSNSIIDYYDEKNKK
jgi:predicted short-subunit dehydrogenase-like oxidoreductase (DUF2520 family)